jgi:predicted nuclease of predicted toxin-antitoxin system
VKLLLDQNLSRRLAPELQVRYPGSSQAYLLGLHKATDSDLWYYARHHGFALVTKNTDLVDLCVLRGAPPKVFWVRTGNCSTAVVRELLARNVDRIAQFEHEEGVVLSLFPLVPM